MPRYYVSKHTRANGDHDVHTEDCSFLPRTNNRVYLGNFSSGQLALTEAGKRYTKANGCYHCLKQCHY